jgi:hypothetical protein
VIDYMGQPPDLVGAETEVDCLALALQGVCLVSLTVGASLLARGPGQMEVSP